MPTRTGSDYGKVLGALCLLYIGAILFAQLSLIVDPSYLHEQQRSLFRYHQVADPGLFAGDYIAYVISAFPRPHLYEWATRLWLWAGGDLVVLHRLLPLVCWLAFLAGMAVAARRLGDRITMLAAVAVAVAQPVYLHQIAGASPHAFGFPLLIWGLVALLHGSVRGLALATLLASLLYTAMAPVLGLLLTWQVFVMQGFLRLANPDRLKALLLLAGTAALSLWLLYLSLGQPEGLGTPLAPLQQADVYPENGPDGPYLSGVFTPLLYVAGKALSQFRTTDVMLTLPVLLACGLVAAYGLLTLPRGGSARTALTGFILCSLAVGLAVYLLKPHHSYRFVLYPLFTILPLLTVTGLQNFWRRGKRFARFSNALTVAVLAPLVLAADSLEPKKFGYWFHLEAEDREVLAFAAAQPPETVFAIWPSGDSEFDFIPYLARRPLFVMIKAHFPTHDAHVLTMRARTYALIDAYLATDAAPLQGLHCRWGVDYLIVTKAHFAKDGSRPEYFAPFDARIEEIWRSHRREDFLLSDPAPELVALETASHVVVQLGAAGVAAPGKDTAACEPRVAGNPPQ
jgi:hypothetical protein